LAIGVGAGEAAEVAALARADAYSH